MMNRPKLFDLADHVIVVAGGSGLYGLPISQALAEAGATVVIASRTLDANRESAKQLQARGLQVHAEFLDLGQEQSVGELSHLLLERFGKIDVLVNSAVLRPVKDFWSSTPEQWEESARVNVSGIHFCARVFGQVMLHRKSGNIINVSSIYGVVGPHFPIYAGTQVPPTPPDYAFHRGGIISYTRYLAALFAPHVRVNCLTLGGLRDPGEDALFMERYAQHCPLGRKAEERDVHGPIVFLASPASSYMTGHNLVVDGGWTAW